MLTQILQMYLMFQAIRWLMGSSAPKADEAAKKVEPMITERSALVDMTVYLAESSAYERGVQMRDWSNFTAIWHERAIPLIPEKPLFKARREARARPLRCRRTLARHLPCAAPIPAGPDDRRAVRGPPERHVRDGGQVGGPPGE